MSDLHFSFSSPIASFPLSFVGRRLLLLHRDGRVTRAANMLGMAGVDRRAEPICNSRFEASLKAEMMPRHFGR